MKNPKSVSSITLKIIVLSILSSYIVGTGLIFAAEALGEVFGYHDPAAWNTMLLGFCLTSPVLCVLYGLKLQRARRT